MKLRHTFSALKRGATRARLGELACAAMIASACLTVAAERAEVPAIRAFAKAAQEHSAFEDAMSVTGAARDTIVARYGGKLAGDLYTQWTDDVGTTSMIFESAARLGRARNLAYAAAAFLVVLWGARRVADGRRERRECANKSIELCLLDGMYGIPPSITVDGNPLNQRAVAALQAAIYHYTQHAGDHGLVPDTPQEPLRSHAVAVRELLLREWRAPAGMDTSMNLALQETTDAMAATGKAGIGTSDAP